MICKHLKISNLPSEHTEVCLRAFFPITMFTCFLARGPFKSLFVFWIAFASHQRRQVVYRRKGFHPSHLILLIHSSLKQTNKKRLYVFWCSGWWRGTASPCDASDQAESRALARLPCFMCHQETSRLDWNMTRELRRFTKAWIGIRTCGRSSMVEHQGFDSTSQLWFAFGVSQKS